MAKLYETKALQNEGELKWLVDLFLANGVRSYLEIGSKFGGSLWRISKVLPYGAKIVSVDLPGKKETEESLRACINELQTRGYQAHFVNGDSRSPTIIDLVRHLAPFDACLIDADHSLEAVTADWTNYSVLCTKLVAFHDIAWYRPANWTGGYRIDVPRFWAEIKGNFRYEECCFEKQDNGIGVIWL